MNIKQYKDVEHPFHLPGDIDLFTWSIPFLADKVTEMLYSIIGRNVAYSPANSKELEHIDFSKLLKDYNKEESKIERSEILRTKVKTVARMARIFKNLRQECNRLISIIGNIMRCQSLLKISQAMVNYLEDYFLMAHLRSVQR